MPPPTNTPEKKAGLAYWANRVLEECDKASQDFAPDPVHDLRVAIRRCRSMADGFMSVDPDPKWKQMKKAAKPLFSSLGDLRDAQVMMEWVAKLSEESDPVRHVLLHSLSHKEHALKAVAQQSLQAFDRNQWLALNAHLAGRTGKVPIEDLVFQHLALERWMEAHELQRQALRNRTQVGYHQLRIGIKRFRYTVENFLPLRHEQWSRDLRDLQDALGEVHDFDVLRAMLRAHPELATEDRERWYARIAAERQKRLDLYRQKMLGKISLWPVWRAELPSGPALEKAALEKLRTWAAFLDPDFRHTVHVTRLALQLYDALARQQVLSADPEQRRILRAAALVHEVGRRKNKGGHRKRADRLLGKLKPPLGWSKNQLRDVAVVARFHRGALPSLETSHFVGVPTKRRRELAPLAGILRLANAFDEAHEHRVTRISVERRDGSLIVYAQGIPELSPAAEKIARASYLLEATCKLPILIRSLTQQESPMSPGVAARRRKLSGNSPGAS